MRLCAQANKMLKFRAIIFLLLPWLLPASPPIVFENAVARSGIDFVLDNSATPQKHQIETMMAGVAALDYDNDGWLDLYFANGARLPGMDKTDPKFANRLYRNQGDGTFEDVTERA